MHHPRTNHIHTRHHYVRHLIEEEKPDIKHVSMKNMIPEILTKPLAAEEHRICNSQLGLQNAKKYMCKGSSTMSMQNLPPLVSGRK